MLKTARKSRTPAPKKAQRRTLADFSKAEINSMDTEKFGHMLLQEIRMSPPLLSGGDLDKIEARFRDGTLGQPRRCALAILLKPGAWLLENVEKDRGTAVAFADVAQRASEYAIGLRQIADLVGNVATRINVVLCIRDDMGSVVDEARHG